MSRKIIMIIFVFSILALVAFPALAEKEITTTLKLMDNNEQNIKKNGRENGI